MGYIITTRQRTIYNTESRSSSRRSPSVRQLRVKKDWQWWRGFGGTQPNSMLHVFIIWRLHLLIIKKWWSNSCTIVEREGGPWIIKFFKFREKTKNLSLTWFHLNSSNLLQGNNLKDDCYCLLVTYIFQTISLQQIGWIQMKPSQWQVFCFLPKLEKLDDPSSSFPFNNCTRTASSFLDY
jgi:hypothetical protein